MRTFFAALVVLCGWASIALAQGTQYPASAWGLPRGVATYLGGSGTSTAPQPAFGQPAYGQPAYAPVAYPAGVYEQPSVQPSPVSGQQPSAVHPQPGPGYALPTYAAHDCGTCAPPCPCWHHSGVFGEFLYWQVTGADISYGVPQDGISAPGSSTPPGTVPIADVGVLETGYEPAFRAGFNVALDCDSSVRASYMQFQTRTNDDLFIAPPFVIQPLTTFPGTFNAGFTAQVAAAQSSLEVFAIDLDYRGVLISNHCYHLDGVAGARYAELDQSFGSIYLFAPPDGTTLVGTELDFAGAGLRIGLEGEYIIAPRLGIAGYSKAMASFLGGQFHGSYLQLNQFNGVEAFTTWDDNRLVPVTELECGLTWANRRNNFRLSAGYYFGCWANVVTTSDWINGVQGLNFADISQDEFDTIRFDGLVARAELTL